MQTYLFYDIETTGLNKAFDQVLQFAAIRTDTQLQELARYEVTIKLNPDVIPSPFAVVTHGIGIHDMQQGENELIAIKKIHDLFNSPNTISIGYNTLGFDDEFLRFSFYRNLLPPYHHQFKNQCYRMDIYPMTLCYYLYKHSILKWPSSFKLAELQAANQLAEGAAHDAMVDVQATLSLARILFKEQEMWRYLQGFFHKDIDRERLTTATNRGMCMMIDGRVREQNFQIPVLLLGDHQYYKNQKVFLRLDLQTLTTCTLDTLLTTTRVIQKKLGEPHFIFPFTKNTLPTATTTLAEENKRWLEQHPDIFSAIVNHYTHYQYPVYPETDIDASLYLHGFWTFSEEHFCRHFHTVPEHEKVHTLKEAANERLQQLLFRILGRHYFDTFTEMQQTQFKNYLKKIHSSAEQNTPIDFQGKKRLTATAALQEISTLRDTDMPAAKMQLLTELETYLQKLL